MMMKKMKMLYTVLLPVFMIFLFCTSAAASDLRVQLTVPACGA